jgi:hypothetical protein
LGVARGRRRVELENSEAAGEIDRMVAPIAVARPLTMDNERKAVGMVGVKKPEWNERRIIVK